MALLSLGGVCLLLRYLAAASGDDVPVISLTKNESSQVLLDCSLGSEGIRVKKFDWKVNGTQEVFLYDDGDVYTEDPQFKGRVQHESLDSNNASITISNALVKDTGIYECIYIDETNQKTTKSRISLTVGACREPVIRVNETENMANLQCKIKGASPQPTIAWQNSTGHQLSNSVVTEFEQKKGQFYITVEINVTQSGTYRCVAKQQGICHQTQDETQIKITPPEQSTDPGSHAVWIGVSVGLFLLLLVIVVLGCWCHRKKTKALKLKYRSAGARMTS